MSTNGTYTAIEIPAKSVSTLNGERLASASATEDTGNVMLCISRVWPSGLDFATMSAPIDPPAPPRLSTITGCPMDSLMRCATRRATISVVPPAGNGTTILIGFVGKLCAWAPCCRMSAVAAITAQLAVFRNCLLVNMASLPFCQISI